MQSIKVTYCVFKRVKSGSAASKAISSSVKVLLKYNIKHKVVVGNSFVKVFAFNIDGIPSDEVWAKNFKTRTLYFCDNKEGIIKTGSLDFSVRLFCYSVTKVYNDDKIIITNKNVD